MNLKPLLIVPPLALGVSGYFWITQPQDQVQTTEPDNSVAVRVVTVATEPVVVTARGFGRVEASETWTAISEVDGRVTEVVRGLAVGTIVQAGDLLVKVDPTDYELAVEKSRANLASAEANLQELSQQEANSSRLMEVENRILEVAQAEFDRAQDLQARGTGTQASLDTAQKTLLAQQSSVTNLRNTIDLYPAQSASLEATVAVRKAELREARRALENTAIYAPFRGRISQEAVDEGRFVRVGAELLSLESVEAVEVVAAFQPQSLGRIGQAALGSRFQEMSVIDTTRALEFLKEAGVAATVHLQLAAGVATYPAELVRFRGTIDSATGTFGIAVRVDDPLLTTTDAPRPPLNVGSFVSVEISTLPVEGLITIPRAALRQDDKGAAFVYIANTDDQLEIRHISSGPPLNDRVVVRDGLSEGDRLILSDPQPPIEGLELIPVPTERDD